MLTSFLCKAQCLFVTTAAIAEAEVQAEQGSLGRLCAQRPWLGAVTVAPTGCQLSCGPWGASEGCSLSPEVRVLCRGSLGTVFCLILPLLQPPWHPVWQGGGGCTARPRSESGLGSAWTWGCEVSLLGQAGPQEVTQPETRISTPSWTWCCPPVVSTETDHRPPCSSASSSAVPAAAVSLCQSLAVPALVALSPA